jgi:TonB family protein
MFEVLLESRHVRPPRPVVATVFSAALHFTIVILGIGGATVAATSDEMNPLWDKIARFLAPPNKSGGSVAEKLSYVGLEAAGSVRGEQSGAPVTVKEQETQGEAVRPQQIAPAVELNELAKLQIAAQAVGAFSVIDVDSAAERDPMSAAPAYPAVMLDKQIEGAATMRFVIDSTGLIDLKTIAVQKATHPEFVKAVEAAMPRMHFRPALRGSLAVRQLVEQEFKFQIKLPTPVTQPKAIKP